MTISKAIKNALPLGRGITRKAWGRNPATILPTNTTESCLYISHHDNGIAPRWQPRLDDLVADDWEVYG